MAVGTERRHTTRLALALPALVTGYSPADGSNACLELTTRNISSRGAFFVSPGALPLAAKIEVAVIVQASREGLAVKKDHSSCVRLSGQVIRRDPDGFAVCFDNHYHVVPLAKALVRLEQQLLWLRRNNPGARANKLALVG
jgi:hypothetical protein